MNHSITTTLIKAKETRRYTEKLITIAKKGGLANRRLVIARLDSIEVGNHLMDVVAPAVQRNSGYLRIERTGYRKGDNAEMATISFVDKIAKSNAQDNPSSKSEPTSDPKQKLKPEPKEKKVSSPRSEGEKQ